MEHDIATWLNSLGLERYSEASRSNDIDVRALRHLTEADLRELGVSLGHRKVLLAAIAELKEEPGSSPGAPQTGWQSDPPGRSDQAERRLLSVLFCDLVG